MQGVLLAELAVFVEFDSVRRILFILHSVIITLFAFGTCYGYSYTHYKTPPKKLHPLKVLNYITTTN